MEQSYFEKCRLCYWFELSRIRPAKFETTGTDNGAPTPNPNTATRPTTPTRTRVMC